MKNSIEKNQESGEQISPEEFNNIAKAMEHFIKYQLPLHNITNNSILEDSEYKGLNPDNNISHNFFNQDPLSQFLSDKRKFLNKSLDEVVALINEREQIKDSNIYQIDKDICKVHTKMFNLSWQRYNFNFDTDKAYHKLQQLVMALNREKRSEDVACWKDVTQLKSYLRESLKEAEQEKRKQAILKGNYK